MIDDPFGLEVVSAPSLDVDPEALLAELRWLGTVFEHRAWDARSGEPIPRRAVRFTVDPDRFEDAVVVRWPRLPDASPYAGRLMAMRFVFEADDALRADIDNLIRGEVEEEVARLNQSPVNGGADRG